jgi:hypothetical protein
MFERLHHLSPLGTNSAPQSGDEARIDNTDKNVNRGVKDKLRYFGLFLAELAPIIVLHADKVPMTMTE